MSAASAGPPLSLSFQGVWHASEMAVGQTTTYPSGFAAFDAELPGKGWPRSALIELLLQQAGIGEMQLLKPALVKLSGKQRIALVHPPYRPHAMACKSWGINCRQLLWLDAKSTADALWTTEQILKNGSCGAVVLWQSNIRTDALRRLNLAAQSTDTWFWLMRPLSCRLDSSPAPLRIALRPAAGGVSLEIVKRRGPHCEESLFVALADMPAGTPLLDKEHAPMVKRPPIFATARDAAPVLV